MPEEKALDMFGDLILSPRPQVTIANIDWNVLKPIYEAQRFRPMLADFDQASTQPTNGELLAIPRAVMLEELIQKLPEDRRQSIETFVQEQAAHVLGFRHGELPPVDIPLTELGLDSLMAVDLKNRLQAGVGQSLAPTVVFDYPSVSDMAGMLDTMLWTAHGSVDSNLAAAEKDEIRI